MDVQLLHSAAAAGGYIVANAAISEPVKDAYRALKVKLGEIFGRRAVSALDKIETEATRAEGESELAALVPNLRQDEADELSAVVTSLLNAIQMDPTSQTLIRQARISLDLNAGGDISLSRIRGADDLGVRANASGDIAISDIIMGPGGLPGK